MNAPMVAPEPEDFWTYPGFDEDEAAEVVCLGDEDLEDYEPDEPPEWTAAEILNERRTGEPVQDYGSREGGDQREQPVTLPAA